MLPNYVFLLNIDSLLATIVQNAVQFCSNPRFCRYCLLQYAVIYLLLRYFLFGRQVRVGKSDKKKSWYNPSHFVHLYNAILPREFHDCFPMSYIRPEPKICHWLAKELKQVRKPISFYRKKSEHI